jgi:hypothetical protein
MKKLVKKPTFWIVIAFLIFMGWVGVGYLLPAQMRVLNETNAELKNLRLKYETGEWRIDKLPAGQTAQAALKLPSGELTLSLESAGGTPYVKQFPHTAGPRDTSVIHVVETGDVVKLFETRANWVMTSNEYMFNMSSSEQ